RVSSYFLSRKGLEILARVAPYVFGVGLLLLLSTAVHIGTGLVAAPRRLAWFGICTKVQSAFFAAARFQSNPGFLQIGPKFAIFIGRFCVPTAGAASCWRRSSPARCACSCPGVSM